jgi:hypothetical protein
LSQFECERVSSVPAWVKLGSIQKSAGVVHCKKKIGRNVLRD